MAAGLQPSHEIPCCRFPPDYGEITEQFMEALLTYFIFPLPLPDREERRARPEKRHPAIATTNQRGPGIRRIGLPHDKVAGSQHFHRLCRRLFTHAQTMTKLCYRNSPRANRLQGKAVNWAYLPETMFAQPIVQIIDRPPKGADEEKDQLIAGGF